MTYAEDGNLDGIRRWIALPFPVSLFNNRVSVRNEDLAQRSAS